MAASTISTGEVLNFTSSCCVYQLLCFAMVLNKAIQLPYLVMFFFALGFYHVRAIHLLRWSMIPCNSPRPMVALMAQRGLHACARMNFGMIQP